MAISIAKLRVLTLILLSLSVTACASSKYSDVYDPFEGSNRAVFQVNEVLDKSVAKPVAMAYRKVLPEPARLGVRNVLRNLQTPMNAGNQLLQGDIEGTATDIGRAVINTTIGIGGLFDIAGYFGLKYEQEDFGQTLGVWGLSEGPYFVIPFLGPSNLRDSVGRVVDNFADPLNLYLHNTEQEEWMYARAGVSLVDQRESLIEVLEELESGAIDYYAVMRSSYTQFRRAQINDNREVTGMIEIPDFEDE